MVGERSPLLALDFSTFDFAAYEQEIIEGNVEIKAQQVLAGILTIQGEDNAPRSYAQIQKESEMFFANPFIMQLATALDALSMQYASFCVAHGEGGAILTNEGLLGEVLERGLQRLEAHEHDHAEHVPHRVERSKKAKKDKKKSVTQWIARQSLRKLAAKKAA